MASQTNPRIQTARKSGSRNKARNLARMSAFLCILSGSTTTALTTGTRSAFLRTSSLRMPTSAAPFVTKEQKLSPPTRWLSYTPKRVSVLAASTASETATQQYDIINKKNGLDKYEPGAFESEIYKWWEHSGCFQPDAKPKGSPDDKKPYVLPMPPPNVTGRLHMGHAIFVALQDVLARFHRMRGRPVLWLPGA